MNSRCCSTKYIVHDAYTFDIESYLIVFLDFTDIHRFAYLGFHYNS